MTDFGIARVVDRILSENPTWYMSLMKEFVRVNPRGYTESMDSYHARWRLYAFEQYEMSTAETRQLPALPDYDVGGEE